MRCVLFLGAGFSAPFGLPVLKEFFEKALNSESLSQDDKEFLTSLRSRARSANAFLVGSNHDLEHILSIALMAGRSLGIADPDPATDAYVRLCRILGLVFSQYDNAVKERDMAKQLRSLLGAESWPGNTKLDILTTNYDLTAELALATNGLAPTLPVAWTTAYDQDSSQSLYSTRNHPIVLHKLHGSINWELRDDRLLVFDHLAPAHHLTDRSMVSGLWPRMLVRDGARPERPLIVPPSLYKAQPHSVLDPMWSRARDALAQADRLAFIGFSFPDSDTYMKYFFADALTDNTNLPEIKIVDPNATEIVRRLRESEANQYGSQFLEMLSPLDADWRRSGFTILR